MTNLSQTINSHNTNALIAMAETLWNSPKVDDAGVFDMILETLEARLPESEFISLMERIEAI